MAKERNETITNIKHSSSLSLISAITSSGWLFNEAAAGNINSKLLVGYLKEIMNFFSEQHGVKKENFYPSG